MTIPKEWLKPGAVVPVNNDTVHRLIQALNTITEENPMPHFEELEVLVTFHVAFNRFNSCEDLAENLQDRINLALGDYFSIKQRGTYTNPAVTVKKEIKPC